MNSAEAPFSSGRWRYLALGILVLSFLATGALVGQWLLGKPDQSSLARYLPDQSQFVGYVRWDRVRQSEAYRQLRALGGWSERDEEDSLRFLGVAPSAIQSIFFAGDLQSGGQVALVGMHEPFQVDTVLDHLRIPKQDANIEGDAFFTVGDLAYCKVADNQLFLGERGLVRKVLQRKSLPLLSVGLAEFVSSLPGGDGIRLASNASALAESRLAVQGVDLSPILQAFARPADFCAFQCDFTSNLDISLFLKGKKDVNLAATGIDFAGVDESPREKISAQLRVPDTFFDMQSWKLTRQQAWWAMEVTPRAALDPLLEELVPGFFWTRLLQDPAHTRHQKARQALREQEAAVPYLARALADKRPPIRAEVIRALADLGKAAEPALPHLAHALDDASATVRLEAVRAFPIIGPRSPLTRLALLKCLNDPLPAVHAAALAQLAKLAPPTLEEVPGMVSLTKSRHPVFWRELLRELGLLGAQARAQESLDNPLIEGMLQGLTIDDEIDLAARLQLRKIRPFSLRERPLLLKVLRAPTGREQARAYALTALAEDGLASADLLGEIGQCLQKDPSPLVRQAAADALGHVKTDSPLATRLLIEAFQDSAADVRLTAVAALGKLGPGNPEIISELIRLLESPQTDVQTQACFALGNFGQKALLARPALLKLAPTSTGLLRSTAEQALQNIGVPQPADARGLAGLLKTSTDRTVRWCTAKLIDELGPRAGADLFALCREIDNTDPAVRLLALSALRKQGKCPAELLPDLLNAMEDVDKTVRLSALGLIPLLDVAQYRPLLENWLAVSEPEARLEILRSLAIVGTKASDLTAAVVPRLHDKEMVVRIQAVKTLAELCPDGELAAVRPALVKLLSEKEALVRLQVMELIKKRGAPLVPLLKEALGGNDTELRLMALLTTKALGNAAEECLLEVRKCLAPSAPPKLRLPALAALGAIGPGTEQAAKELSQLLKEDNAALRKAVLPILAGLGPKAWPAKENLITLLRRVPRDEFEVALTTFRELKLEPKERVFLLLGAFRNPDVEVRALLVQEISKIGRTAVFPLTEQLDHALPSVRLGVLLTLAQIGGEAEGAVAALQRRFQTEPLSQLREEILNTLEKIQN